MGEYVVAVDVGTGSARAGVFDRRGVMISRSARPIQMRRADAFAAEHSSDDIWAAVVASVRDAISSADIDADDIDAIGFDATCSLVFLDAAGRPVSIAKSGDAGWDTIAWLDHRAIAEAESATALQTEAVRHSGEIVSPEMQIPKIMWVRDHLPDAWAKTAMILDLADYLTWRATSNATRSACTLTAKWNYLNHRQTGWDDAFLAGCGLPDLPARAGVPGPPVAIGSTIGTLCPAAAQSLGLSSSCRVAPGMVDAYAGTLALTGPHPEAVGDAALIGGTSSCVMRFSDTPHFLRTFWGPYLGSALPGRWIMEGGQSAAGALLDHILHNHLGRVAHSDDHAAVLADIDTQVGRLGDRFGAHVHMLPDFHGNRTPHGNASALGAIQGLSLDNSASAFSVYYYRAMVALALGMRQIIEALEKTGSTIERLHLGGGHARNALLAKLYADATGRTIVISSGDEAMLLGTAINAASAAGWLPTIEAACKAFARPQRTIQPDPERRAALDRDYRIFLRMQAHRDEIVAMG
jgi:FGGY-family pentulose kinase